MSLDLDNYTVFKALTWGNCSGHFKKAQNSHSSWQSRTVHIIIAAIESIPVVSQIVSLAELVLAKYVNLYGNSNTTLVPTAVTTAEASPLAETDVVEKAPPPIVDSDFRAKPPEDCHFTKTEILKIGDSLVGYRHVSSEEEHQRFLTEEGDHKGCSYNISFGSSSDKGRGPFFILNHKIQERSIFPDQVTTLIQQYDQAVSSFIQRSVNIDLRECITIEKTTYKDFFKKIYPARFMLVKTIAYEAADGSAYEGLGRFSQEPMPAEQLILLESIKKEDMEDLIMDKTIDSKEECEILFDRVVAIHRKNLLLYFREQFNAADFKRHYDYYSLWWTPKSRPKVR